MKMPLRHALALLFPLPFAFISAAAAGEKDIVIDAADLAPPEVRADKPTAGKWWLNRDAKDWGAPKGNILLTGQPSDKPNKQGEWVVTATERFVPHRLPALIVDPKATGWHRIYVGLYHQAVDPMVRPMLLGRLSGEPRSEERRVGKECRL